MDAEPVDRRVADLAAAQHGVVARGQLEAIGLGRGAIAGRIRSGRLHPVHRAVYAVGHPCLGRHGRWMAAVLAGGPGAVLSHRSAAELWGLLPPTEARIHTTVPAAGGRDRRPGVAIHRSSVLRPQDRAVAGGIPVTSVARTLLDVAATSQASTTARAVDEAEALRLFDLLALDDLLGRHPGQPGTAALRRAIAEWSGPVVLRSDLERRFLRLCREHGVPAPLPNAHVAGLEVDFLWVHHRLVAETDGHRHHGTRAAFERDRARDARLLEAGFRVVRFTHRRVTRDPAAVARTLRRLLTV